MSSSSRLLPILHVSFSSSSEGDYDVVPPRKRVPSKRPLTQTRFTLPDSSITEREPISSDEDAGASSLRNILKVAVAHALSSSSALEERLEQLSISGNRIILSHEDRLGEDFSALSLEGPSATSAKTHRRIYAGSQMSRRALPSPSDRKRIRSASNETTCIQRDQVARVSSFTCSHCGHCFTLRRSLDMHRKVCPPSTNERASTSRK